MRPKDRSSVSGFGGKMHAMQSFQMYNNSIKALFSVALTIADGVFVCGKCSFSCHKCWTPTVAFAISNALQCCIHRNGFRTMLLLSSFYIRTNKGYEWTSVCFSLSTHTHIFALTLTQAVALIIHILESHTFEFTLKYNFRVHNSNAKLLSFLRIIWH